MFGRSTLGKKNRRESANLIELKYKKKEKTILRPLSWLVARVTTVDCAGRITQLHSLEGLMSEETYRQSQSESKFSYLCINFFCDVNYAGMRVVNNITMSL